MPQLSFKSQFVGLVQSGKKTQTIRKHRVRPFVVGDRLYLCTGARTKQWRPIGEGIVSEVAQITIAADQGEAEFEFGYAVHVDGVLLDWRQGKSLAVADGFTSCEEMCRWFERVHGLPFSGSLIRWKLQTAP